MTDEKNGLEPEQTESQDIQHEWSGTPLGEWSGAAEKPTAENSSEQDVENATEEPQTEISGEPPAVEQEKPEEPDVPKPQESPKEQVDYGDTLRTLEEGDVVQGVVVHIDKEGVLVDVGAKSEGIIKPNEVSRDPNVTPEEAVQVGESIDVYVLQSEGQDGGLVLSKKRADFERAWTRVLEARETGKILTAMVTDRVKGGLVVDLGVRGFVPASHVGSGNVRNLDRYVGQSIPLKVIEVDSEKRKVVLSNKLAVENEREKKRAETLKNLAEGQVRPGIVRRITDYGAFVDLGGIDGLLHISEMSWTRISHPSEVVKVGQKIHVMVLKLDLAAGKVSLGLRQILPDPWADIERTYSVGDVIVGTVTRLVPFGAFVQVAGGVEGIIPNSELATRRVSKPEDVVSVGQSVEAKIIDLRPDERRMTLSLRALQQVKEKSREQAELEAYNRSRDSSRITIGDLVGDKFGDVREAAKSSRREKRRREREVEELVEEEAMEELVHEDLGAEQVSEVAPVEAEESVEPAVEVVEVEVSAEPAAEENVEVAEDTAVEEPCEKVEISESPKSEAEEDSDEDKES